MAKTRAACHVGNHTDLALLRRTQGRIAFAFCADQEALRKWIHSTTVDNTFTAVAQYGTNKIPHLIMKGTTTILIPPRRPLIITQYMLRAVPTHQIVNAAPRNQQKARVLRDSADTGDSMSPPLSRRDKDALSTKQRPITALILALVIFSLRLKHLQPLIVHVAFPVFLVHLFLTLSNR